MQYAGSCSSLEKKCIANAGDCVENYCFVAENFLYHKSVIVLLLAAVVSMGINRRHYFRNDPHMIKWVAQDVTRCLYGAVPERYFKEQY